jgi:uncharacterized protein (DUF2147 family)
MKKIVIILVFVIMNVFSYAQGQDAILGKWQNPTGEGRIEIYKKGNKYFGKIYWLQEPNNDQGTPKLDVKNPDPAKQSRQVKDMEILTNIVYKGKNVWSEGKNYDPKSGNTYSCKMTLKSPNSLYLRGYVGLSLFGRSEVWTRVTDQ